MLPVPSVPPTEQGGWRRLSSLTKLQEAERRVFESTQEASNAWGLLADDRERHKEEVHKLTAIIRHFDEQSQDTEDIREGYQAKLDAAIAEEKAAHKQFSIVEENMAVTRRHADKLAAELDLARSQKSEVRVTAGTSWHLQLHFKTGCLQLHVKTAIRTAIGCSQFAWSLLQVQTERETLMTALQTKEEAARKMRATIDELETDLDIMKVMPLLAAALPLAILAVGMLADSCLTSWPSRRPRVGQPRWRRSPHSR